ncbi:MULTISPECIES: hypothetical protein [Flavobacterium]|uniref:hypothetical protein n=1 Tax=Flavobacterium TaxID=237 RepID=UPI001FCC873E|nr:MULTISPECIES: hypothetical protein [Flavobacterium]UOK42533.1 hypothetical protein LZF87_14650 [Flavobacterium enshiense]
MSIQKPNEESRVTGYLKVAPAVLTTVGVLVGALQYNSNYDKEIRKNTYNTTFDIYQEFTEKCAVLSHYEKDSVTTESFNRDYKDFEKIYFGKFLLVQDSTVSDQAQKYYDLVNNFKQKGSSTSNSDLEDGLLNLISASRNSLNKIIEK